MPEAKLPEPKRIPCAYQVVRYIPNLVRDEWVNIGVVLFDPASGQVLRRMMEEADFDRLHRRYPRADGNLLQRLQCWYFRSAEFECLRRGKEICFAFSGLNQYHAIMDYGGCPSVAPSSGAVALLALDANLELTSAAKGKRLVSIREFYVHPDANPQRYNVMGSDELLTAIYVPKPAAGTRSAYQKYGEKESNDWAIADAGIVLEMDGNLCRRAVVTMSAASPVVRRSQEAEAVLTGKTITPELARAAGQASMHGAMPLSMNAYKVQLFPVAIYRTVLLAAGQMGRDPSAAS